MYVGIVLYIYKCHVCMYMSIYICKIYVRIIQYIPPRVMAPADKPQWFNVVHQIYGCIPYANPTFRMDIIFTRMHIVAAQCVVL